MKTKTAFILGEFARPSIGRKAATAKVPSPENPPIRASSTENTMVEILAQFLNRNRPMPVEIPQMARRTYMSVARENIALVDAGEPGSLSRPRLEPRKIRDPVSVPMARQSADPMNDITPISVTPIERCKEASRRMVPHDRAIE
jgi:hypothetical protein